MEHAFTLRYRVNAGTADDEIMSRLAQAGCDDALVGLGIPGEVLLGFTRTADNRWDAMEAAHQAVAQALPDAVLLLSTDGEPVSYRGAITSATDFPAVGESHQIALEADLAIALGWTHLELSGLLDDDLYGRTPGEQISGRVPAWTRDWDECAELMVLHAAFPQADWVSAGVGGVTVFPGTPWATSVVYEWFGDAQTAVRCAIVEAVTKKVNAEAGRG